MGCNVGMGVGDKFDDGVGQKSCFACHYTEEDNGDISGNKNCPELQEGGEEFTRECPNWASNGCYTGTAVHNVNTDDAGRREEVYKEHSANNIL